MISANTRQWMQSEILPLETLITSHKVTEERAKQLRNFFSISPWNHRTQDWIRRAYWTADDVCLVTRWAFIDAVNWMTHCDRVDQRRKGRRS